MCGRYSISSTAEQLQQRFDVAVPAQFAPRYNAAPTQNLPIILHNDAGRKLDFFRWGLIPKWADDPAIGNKMINARAETVAQKPSFKEAYRQRRCLVLADGYYEWQATVNGKQPMRFVLSDAEPFAFAGLWETWHEGVDQINSFTIITTSANPLAAAVHQRMPVILPRDAETVWLNPKTDPIDLHELLMPYQGNDMRVYPVAKTVNSPSNDNPDIIKPI